MTYFRVTGSDLENGQVYSEQVFQEHHRVLSPMATADEAGRLVELNAAKWVSITIRAVDENGKPWPTV